MHRWGMAGSLTAMSVDPQNLWWKRWDNGKIIARTKYKPNFEQDFGVSYRVIHRAHLHGALHAKAVELGVHIELGRTVQEYNPERPSIRFKTGGEVFPDLVIAADGRCTICVIVEEHAVNPGFAGLKSSARHVITGKQISLRNHGFAAYRACVSVEEMRKNPLIAKNMDFDSLCLWSVATYVLTQYRRVLMIKAGWAIRLMSCHILSRVARTGIWSLLYQTKETGADGTIGQDSLS